MLKREKMRELALMALGMGTALAAADASATGKKDAHKKHEATIQCYGINGCKGKGGCATPTPGQMALANKHFNNVFANVKPSECAGHNECKGKGWVAKKTEKECFDDNGFIFAEENGKPVIKTKDGVKAG